MPQNHRLYGKPAVYLAAAMLVGFASPGSAAAQGLSQIDEINLSAQFIPGSSTTVQLPNGVNFVAVDRGGNQICFTNLDKSHFQFCSPLPAGAHPAYILTANNKLYVTEPGTHQVAIIDTTGAGDSEQLSVPTLNDSSPGTIWADSAGNVYVSTGNGGITVIAPDNTVVGRSPPPGMAASASGLYLIPTPPGAAGPPSALNMTTGADGNLWFTETPATDASGNPIVNGTEKIGRMTPAGVITEFAVPTKLAGSGSTFTTAGTFIILGPDGNVWFTESIAGKVAKITPAGIITEYPLGVTFTTVLGLASGADGNIWVRAFGGKIFRVTPSGTVTTFPVPTVDNASDVELILAPDGALWFPEATKIGRISTTGSITELAIPTPTVSGAPNFPFQLAFNFKAGGGGFLESTAKAIAVFTGPSGAGALLSAVLPASRSVQVGKPATAFATMINSGTNAGTACAPALVTNIAASFNYQTTDPKTNALTGTANTPANIAAGGSQSFVIAFTPNAPFNPTDTIVGFACANADAASITIGLNTLLLSGSVNPVPDIVALAASGDPGFVDIPGANGTGVFAVATVNVGAAGAITATANTGSATLPVSIWLCQTDPKSGVCINPTVPGPSVTTTINANATPTFGIFVTGSGTVANLPQTNRITVQFADSGGTVRGATSVAVRTQ